MQQLGLIGDSYITAEFSEDLVDQRIRWRFQIGACGVDIRELGSLHLSGVQPITNSRC